MKECPPQLHGHAAEQMRLVCYALLLRSECRVVAGKSLLGVGPREECGMAVYDGDGGYYAFTCDAEWNVIWDDWTASEADALASLKASCPGIGSRWCRPSQKGV